MNYADDDRCGTELDDVRIADVVVGASDGEEAAPERRGLDECTLEEILAHLKYYYNASVLEVPDGVTVSFTVEGGFHNGRVKRVVVI